MPKIAIVGFAEGHNLETPFGDPEWDTWGINRLHVAFPEARWSAWFNLHDLEKFHGQDHEHLAWLKTFDGPVFLRPQDIGKFDIPNQTPFPIEAVTSKYGRYFNNTISYLIAFALEHDPTDIGVYGVDMAQDDLLNAEYAHQRPSCEFFLGIAAGKGVNVHLPNGSDLLKTSHLYGFEEADHMTQKYLSRLNEVGVRKEKIKMELAQVDNQRGQMIAAINQLDGAMQDCQYWLRNYRPQDPGELFATDLPESVFAESPNGHAVESEAKEMVHG